MGSGIALAVFLGQGRVPFTLKLDGHPSPVAFGYFVDTGHSSATVAAREHKERQPCESKHCADTHRLQPPSKHLQPS